MIVFVLTSLLTYNVISHNAYLPKCFGQPLALLVKVLGASSYYIELWMNNEIDNELRTKAEIVAFAFGAVYRNLMTTDINLTHTEQVAVATSLTTVLVESLIKITVES